MTKIEKIQQIVFDKFPEALCSDDIITFQRDRLTIWLAGFLEVMEREHYLPRSPNFVGIKLPPIHQESIPQQCCRVCNRCGSPPFAIA